MIIADPWCVHSRRQAYHCSRQAARGGTRVDIDIATRVNELSEEEEHLYERAGAGRGLGAHGGTTLAHAQVQLEQMGAGTYEDGPLDIDALNAQCLATMGEQPWSIVWTQARAARTMMLLTWFGLDTRTDAADWWVRKSGADHYAEHLYRLRDWVGDIAGG